MASTILLTCLLPIEIPRTDGSMWLSPVAVIPHIYYLKYVKTNIVRLKASWQVLTTIICTPVPPEPQTSRVTEAEGDAVIGDVCFHGRRPTFMTAHVPPGNRRWWTTRRAREGPLRFSVCVMYMTVQWFKSPPWTTETIMLCDLAFVPPRCDLHCL